MTASPETLVDVHDLTVEYPVGRRQAPLRAVDGVDLSIGVGETVGLVGESGSGKTTLGKAILGLCEITSGEVTFAGERITHASGAARRSLRLQAVFQDPYNSLNPARTIGRTLAASLSVYQTLRRGDLETQIATFLERVGLPSETAGRYPIQFSGGQLQRIAIARALIVQPRMIVCDEPVSGLDLSVQAQVLNLLGDLQDEFDVSYLFIAHDFDVVRHLSRRIVVLYRGRVMEHGDAIEICERPRHPYTQTLLDAVPLPDPKLQRERRSARRRIVPERDEGPSAGCPFVARCDFASDVCAVVAPPLEETTADTFVACHHWRNLPGYAGSSVMR